jgi:hypothetical protein
MNRLEERLILQALVFLLSATDKTEVNGIKAERLIEALRTEMRKE